MQGVVIEGDSYFKDFEESYGHLYKDVVVKIYNMIPQLGCDVLLAW